MAERVGFEPTGPFGSPVFKTGSLNRSDTFPQIGAYIYYHILFLPVKQFFRVCVKYSPKTKEKGTQ